MSKPAVAHSSDLEETNSQLVRPNNECSAGANSGIDGQGAELRPKNQSSAASGSTCDSRNTKSALSQLGYASMAAKGVSASSLQAVAIDMPDRTSDAAAAPVDAAEPGTLANIVSDPGSSTAATGKLDRTSDAVAAPVNTAVAGTSGKNVSHTGSQTAATVELPKRIDFVIVVNKESVEKDPDVRSFVSSMRAEGLAIFTRGAYVLVHCPFERLRQEAMDMELRMPLKENKVKIKRCFEKCVARICQSGNREDDDLVLEASAPLSELALNPSSDSENTNALFTPTLRSLLVHRILLSMKSACNLEKCVQGDCAKGQRSAFYLPVDFEISDERANDETDDYVIDQSANKLKVKRISPPLTPKRTAESCCECCRDWRCRSLCSLCESDASINNIRNSFGEETAFYYAWSSVFFWSLVALAIWGFGMVIAGAFASWKELNEYRESTVVGPTEKVCLPSPSWSFFGRSGICRINNGPIFRSDESPQTPKERGDLVADYSTLALAGVSTANTWWFGFVVTVWGWITVAAWRWRRAALASRWHVDRPKANKATRAQYSNDAFTCKDCVTLSIQYLVLAIASASGVGVMIGLNVLRVVINSRCHSGALNHGGCVASKLATFVLNSLITVALSQLIEWLLFKTTRRDNHMTDSAYKHALVVKMVICTGVNEYAPVFYIAFIQGNFEDYGSDGIFGMGPEYKDSCDEYGSCLPELSIYLSTLALAKLVKPLYRIMAARFRCKDKNVGKCDCSQCCCRLYCSCDLLCCKPNCCHPDVRDQHCPRPARCSSASNTLFDIIEQEKKKAPSTTFALERYVEEIIAFGHIVMFSCVAPVTPVAFLISSTFSQILNTRHLYGLYRRPISPVEENVGTWNTIIESLSVIGIITTAFLITALPSSPLAANESARLISLCFYLLIALLIHFILIRFLPEYPSYVKTVRQEERKFVLEQRKLRHQAGCPV